VGRGPAHHGGTARRPSREELFARDDYRCVYCGEVFPSDALSVDHVQPRVRGGDNSGGNVVTACGGCNTRKGHRRLADFLADDPVARKNFRRLARHVWPRHLRALEEELRSRGAG
jgi:5-methylcytosine-specific restriction endonuclease McrA